MPFRHEPGIPVGALGFVAALSLEQINTFVSLLVGLTTLVFVATRWIFFVNTRGGWRAILAPRPPAPGPQESRPPPDADA